MKCPRCKKNMQVSKTHGGKDPGRGWYRENIDEFKNMVVRDRRCNKCGNSHRTIEIFKSDYIDVKRKHANKIGIVESELEDREEQLSKLISAINIVKAATAPGGKK